jgi:DNA-directed RNA polymerase specialized sigma24 family protein
VTQSVGHVTALLRNWQLGDAEAFNQLTEILHEEMRRLAYHYVSKERANHTLQATALVNEAYLRLIDVDVC